MLAQENFVRPDLVMVDRELPIPLFSLRIAESFESILSV
jgi:hypothetical protein